MPDLDTLWFTRCPVPTATGIAADQGRFAAEFGTELTVRSLQDRDAGADVDRQTHFTHRLTGLIREGGNVPALWARARGEATRLIGLTWFEERQAILVRGDDPATGAAAVVGRRLAVPRHDVAIDFWRAMALAGFHGALRSLDLGLADARPVDVPGIGGPTQWEGELAALRDGTVDAVYVKGALAVETAERYGARVAWDLDALPDRRFRVNNGTPRPITVHQSLLDGHFDVVVRFLAVLLDAAEWARTHRSEFDRVLAAETGAAAESVAVAYRADGSRSVQPDLCAERLTLLEQQEAFLRAQGFLAERVPVRLWADPAPLAAAHELVAARRAGAA